MMNPAIAYRKRTATLFLLLFMAIAVYPQTGFGITIKQEENLSREFMRMARRQYAFITDPCVVRWVNKVGNRIVSVIPPQPFKYHFYVIKNDDYNAFASAAGHIFINSGLISAMETEDELAGILAHEIAHASCRHISENIDRSKKLQLASLAGLAGGILLGVGGAGALAQGVMTGTVAGTQSAALAYSREDEIQADEFGLTYLEKAGYSAEGLLTAMERIREKNWFGGESPAYLSTHPAVEDRIAYIGAWIEAKADRHQTVDAKPSYDFLMAHTRLVAGCTETDVALNRFKAAVIKEPESFAAHYGYGLVLGKTGAFDQAIAQLKSALEKRALDSYILADLGKIYYRSGNYKKASSLLAGCIDTETNDPEANLILGCAQLKVGQLKTAAATLEHFVGKKIDDLHSKQDKKEQKSADSGSGSGRSGGRRPSNPAAGENNDGNPAYTQALYYLGEIYHKLDQPGNAYYYLGLYFIDKKDFKTAKHHLTVALKQTEDPERRKQIEKLLERIGKMSERSQTVAGGRSGRGRRGRNLLSLER